MNSNVMAVFDLIQNVLGVPLRVVMNSNRLEVSRKGSGKLQVPFIEGAPILVDVQVLQCMPTTQVSVLVSLVGDLQALVSVNVSTMVCTVYLIDKSKVFLPSGIPATTEQVIGSAKTIRYAVDALGTALVAAFYRTRDVWSRLTLPV